jgi:hypothetical protein
MARRFALRNVDARQPVDVEVYQQPFPSSACRLNGGFHALAQLETGAQFVVQVD